MSVGNKPIKIIKRKQRELPVKPRGPLAHVELKTENQTRRELIRTVTSWIEERKGTKKELRSASFQSLTSPTLIEKTLYASSEFSVSPW
jgi:hypothetical protein